MIHTITLNPSLDYFVQLPELTPGQLHRSEQVRLAAGGKGVNVAVVLQRLGLEVTAHAFAAGQTGQLLQTLLHESGVPVRIIEAGSGMTRINVKLLAQEETEINGAGPKVTAEEFKTLAQGILQDIQAGDGVILSGSACAGADAEMCAVLLEQAAAQGAFTVVDVSGEMLRRLARTKPFCVKPNEAELTALYNETPQSAAQIIACARRLQQEGARNVLVSRGAAGAILVCEDGTVYEKSAYTGQVCGTVGAGDSMVAGFIAGWLQTGELPQALSCGVAAGCAAAFTGQLCTREQFDQLYQI